MEDVRPLAMDHHVGDRVAFREAVPCSVRTLVDDEHGGPEFPSKCPRSHRSTESSADDKKTFLHEIRIVRRNRLRGNAACPR